LGGIWGQNVSAGRRADRIRVAVESLRQSGSVTGHKRYGLTGEAAERALIAAMAERRVLARNFVVVDLDAELRSVAEHRLELGGDRRVIGAGEGGSRERWRRRGGE
jgi:hypothetical protein